MYVCDYFAGVWFILMCLIYLWFVQCILCCFDVAAVLGGCLLVIAGWLRLMLFVGGLVLMPPLVVDL